MKNLRVIDCLIKSVLRFVIILYLFTIFYFFSRCIYYASKKTFSMGIQVFSLLLLFE